VIVAADIGVLAGSGDFLLFFDVTDISNDAETVVWLIWAIKNEADGWNLLNTCAGRGTR
jgi:hypothetical protein